MNPFSPGISAHGAASKRLRLGSGSPAWLPRTGSGSPLSKADVVSAQQKADVVPAQVP